MWYPNHITVCKGADNKFCVHLLKESGEAANISGATAVNIRLKNADNSVLTKNAADGYANGLGLNMIFIYGFILTAQEVALLPDGPNQAIEIEIMFGQVPQYLTYQGALNVMSRQI